MRKIPLIGLTTLSIVLGGIVPAGAAVLPAGMRPSVIGVPAYDSTSPNIAASRVSCSSARSCLAISQNVDSAGNGTPVADAWNGTSWRPVAVPLPRGAGGNLDGLSCKQGSCLVVGTYSTTSGVFTLALRWNGKSLAAAAAPPMPAGSSDVSPGDVSCVAAKN